MMTQIPLVHIMIAFNFVFCLFLVCSLYIAAKKKKDPYVKWYMYAFIALASYFGIVALPGILINNPSVIQVLYTVSYIPSVLAASIFLYVALKIVHWPFADYIFFFSASIISIILISNIFFFTPAEKVQQGSLFHWGEGTDFWLQIMVGVSTSIFLLTTIILFIYLGLNAKNALAKKRSFTLSAGLTFLVLAAIANYIFPMYVSGNFALHVALIIGAGLLSVVSILVLFWGIAVQGK